MLKHLYLDDDCRALIGGKDKCFLHGPGSWMVLANLPSATLIRRELLRPQSRVGFIRWLVLMACAASFFLPVLLEAPSKVDHFQANETVPEPPLSDVNFTTIITSTLHQLCDRVPLQTNEEYVDPVSGFGLVVGVSAVAALWNNRPTWLKQAVTGSITDNKQVVAKATTNKEERALYLLVQLLTVMFSLGRYILWSDSRPKGDLMCTVAARSTLAVFYKPILPAMWYGFMHLLDLEGWMLHHNRLTDTMVAAIISLFLVYFMVAAVFSLPVLVCFIYFGALFCIPVTVFFLVTQAQLSMNEYAISKLSAEEKAEQTAIVLLFKRLLGYTVFVLLVFGIQLWPFYIGTPYATVAKQAMDGIGISFAFWEPQWAWSFRWPKLLSLPDQVALAVSLGFLGLEQMMLGWRWIYWNVLFDASSNPSAWGYAEDRPRTKGTSTA